MQLDGAGYDIHKIGAKIAKSPNYVAARLKLTELVPEVAEAFLKNELTVGHALLIAKLPEALQKEALNEAYVTAWSDGKHDRVLKPIASLQAWIEQHVFLQLDKVPFPKDDATLVPDAGSCLECPKRTGFNKLLFPDTKTDQCKLCGIWVKTLTRLSGMRPPGRKGNGNGAHVNGANGNGRGDVEPNGRQASASGNSVLADLDARILALEKVVGPSLYRSVLREYGRVEQPKLIRDASTKRRVLEILESAVRGLDRLSAARKRVDPRALESLLAKLQAPPLAEIADMKTVRDAFFGLEQLADSPPAHTA